MLRRALTCYVCHVPHIVTAPYRDRRLASVSERRTIFWFSGFRSAQRKTTTKRYAPSKRLVGAGRYARNHAVYASVSTRPAALRAVAGNHASSLPAPSGERAERARHPAQTRFSGPGADGLAAVVRNRSAVAFQRGGVGQPGRLKTGRRVCVAYHLPAGQGAPHQYRPRVVAQIFGLVGPLFDKGAKVQARCHDIFIRVERRETGWRIPAPAPALREGRTEGVRPGRVGNPPPDVRVWNRFAQQLHGQTCVRSNRNMSRHVASNIRVSPRCSKSTRETSSSAWMGLRTTAGIRSRWRYRERRSVAAARSETARARSRGTP